MIPIQNFIDDAIRKVDKLDEDKCLDIRTHKRDRSVMIEKEGEMYNLYEDGFEKDKFIGIGREELRKMLKIMQRKEFPRSNIVRFYVIEKKDKK